MTKLILNYAEIKNLFKNKVICLANDVRLEVLDGNIVLNKNGYLSEMISVSMEFEKRCDINIKIIDFIRDLVCLQLNLEPCNVIFFNQYKDEFQFKIFVHSNYIGKIVVYERRRVEWENSKCEQEENDVRLQSQYRQLFNSAYYFMWLEL